MIDETEAVVAAKLLQDKVEAGEYGMLSGLLTAILEPPLKTTFRMVSEVEEFKVLIDAKLKMPSTPNAARYFCNQLRHMRVLKLKFARMQWSLRANCRMQTIVF